MLVCVVAIGVNDRIAIPDEPKEHGMTEANRGADHDVADDRGELNGRGEAAPLQKLADAGDEATRERFSAAAAGRYRSRLVLNHHGTRWLPNGY